MNKLVSWCKQAMSVYTPSFIGFLLSSFKLVFNKTVYVNLRFSFLLEPKTLYLIAERFKEIRVPWVPFYKCTMAKLKVNQLPGYHFTKSLSYVQQI